MSGSCNRGVEDYATRRCDASAAGAFLIFLKVVHQFLLYSTSKVGLNTASMCKILWL
jgi:hypothetical protein